MPTAINRQIVGLHTQLLNNKIDKQIVGVYLCSNMSDLYFIPISSAGVFLVLVWLTLCLCILLTNSFAVCLWMKVIHYVKAVCLWMKVIHYVKNVSSWFWLTQIGLSSYCRLLCCKHSSKRNQLSIKCNCLKI